MPPAAPLAELWRGDLLESVHHGHAVIVDQGGQVVAAWGDPNAVILPRSSCKMIQALPLIESGAAQALSDEHLALACASHQGADIHTSRVQRWLSDLGLGDDALRCGPQLPPDTAARTALIKSDQNPCQYHNNCSGKHAGFLTLNAHLGGGADYIDPAHPVQTAVKAAFEEVTGEPSPGFGIDGCSAPNFATSVTGLARAMARFACDRSGARGAAMGRLVTAMTTHPDLVAGEGRACTRLMRAMNGRVAIKTGAEGVFVAIAPDQGIGIALKVADGATRAAEAAITALLVRIGALEGADPVAQSYLNCPQPNRRNIPAATLRAVI